MLFDMYMLDKMPQPQRLVFPQLASFRIRGAFWAVVPESVLEIYTMNGRMYEFRTSDGLQWETVWVDAGDGSVRGEQR